MGHRGRRHTYLATNHNGAGTRVDYDSCRGIRRVYIKIFKQGYERDTVGRVKRRANRDRSTVRGASSTYTKCTIYGQGYPLDRRKVRAMQTKFKFGALAKGIGDFAFHGGAAWDPGYGRHADRDARSIATIGTDLRSRLL